MSCKTKNGVRLSKSAYYAKRAGLFHLYRMYGLTQSDDFQKELTTLFRGFLRTVAKEVQNGSGRISTGKVPLSYQLYCEICEWMWQDKTPSGRFAHLFLVLSWNLACRSSNTKTIHFHHLSWTNDCLQIYFAHQKNDQTGDRPRDPRHVYGNPYKPAICPLLTLISYLLVTPPTSDTALFPGGNQYNRFCKYFETLLESKREYILRNYGINIDDIGAHSSRKGASTYMTSGSVSGPTQQAVNIRCGWRMSGVTDTYCRYEAAGDQYCGRILSGLPLFSFRFAVLPPQFDLDDVGKQALDDLILTLFPNLNDSIWKIVKVCIAALAFRENWLREFLPVDHCLFQSSIFWNPNYQLIKNYVQVKLGVGDNNLELDQIRSNEISATGIPSHVVLLASQRNVVIQQKKMVQSNDKIPELIKSAVQESGGIAEHGPEFRAAVQELSNLTDRISNIRVSHEVPTVQPTPQVTGNIIQLHLHQGHFIRIPPTFIFPKSCALRDIFFRFHVKDSVENIPPLKVLDTHSVKHIQRGKATLSDLRFLMGVLEFEARQQNKTTVGLKTQEEASVIFEEIKEGVYKYETKNKRKETLKWSTWSSKCRKASASSVSPPSWFIVDV